MTIVIVDDEQHCVASLLALLEPEIRKGGRVNVFSTVNEAVVGIDSLRPEILFLDIQLQDQTGFDVLQKVSFKEFSLIFTTAYEQYAVTAFKFSAIDYLLKPVSHRDLNHALQQAKQKLKERQFAEKLDVLFSHLPPTKGAKKISIATMDGYVFLDISQIIRCQADINYTYIFTTDGQKHTLSKTLKHFEDLLSAHRFFRVHNSHLINLDHVSKYHKGKGGYVTLSDGSVVEVATRRREAFLLSLNLTEW
ncbi:LytR/AlgR family response regulator transcription factor [Niabella insulamsoli]|uniref:LytR/AlgR family response regulator transcription factor n=1 Tax=Niabella insulamsoli TaxID=3144874 RepID=UPI0031FD1EF9